eukprot:CAMPEP_0172658650 /NCGR_PEP_ID=MMETSP1074-20121228/2905_1 /TAXON_ID=2916 /ORGANISM="Ceratium fusus, Strain PA161109" /LENGTH=133 /DNA_ID=CAMNT_0013473975 /DNA_START=545 /DNA_END=947 /DNA_ORIENTATION=-
MSMYLVMAFAAPAAACVSTDAPEEEATEHQQDACGGTNPRGSGRHPGQSYPTSLPLRPTVGLNFHGGLYEVLAARHDQCRLQMKISAAVAVPAAELGALEPDISFQHDARASAAPRRPEACALSQPGAAHPHP